MTSHFTDDAEWQEQAGYSRAVRRGNVVTVSGTTATGPDGAALHPGDTGAQARACLVLIEQALTALGAGLPDLVRTVVYLAPGASWEQAAPSGSTTTCRSPSCSRWPPRLSRRGSASCGSPTTCSCAPRRCWPGRWPPAPNGSAWASRS